MDFFLVSISFDFFFFWKNKKNPFTYSQRNWLCPHLILWERTRPSPLPPFVPPNLPHNIHMEKGDKWECFKGCESCRGKITTTDSHSLCLFCLGESHVVKTCPHCAHFKAKKAEQSSKTALQPAMESKTQPQHSVSTQSPAGSVLTLSQAQLPVLSVAKNLGATVSAVSVQIAPTET